MLDRALRPPLFPISHARGVALSVQLPPGPRLKDKRMDPTCKILQSAKDIYSANYVENLPDVLSGERARSPTPYSTPIPTAQGNSETFFGGGGFEML